MVVHDPEYHRQWYQKNKDKKRYLKASRRDRAREFVRSQMTPCVVCEDFDPVFMDFHHIHPERKEYNIAQMIAMAFPPERIKLETDKCVCVCANCHRRIHAGKVSLPGVG